MIPGCTYAAESITWIDDNEATLWVTDNAGVMVAMVNLTSLADWRIDGTIETDKELRREWLRFGDS